MTIPVHYYTEITDTSDLNGAEIGGKHYITNVGGKQYLVEILRRNNDGK